MSLIYVNALRNSFKVWGGNLYVNIQTSQSELITYFGRIGMPMQKLRQHTKTFNSSTEAQDFFYKKMQEKRRTGYLPIENHIYFQYVDTKPLSELMTLIEKKYKEFGY